MSFVLFQHPRDIIGQVYAPWLILMELIFGVHYKMLIQRYLVRGKSGNVHHPLQAHCSIKSFSLIEIIHICKNFP